MSSKSNAKGLSEEEKAKRAEEKARRKAEFEAKKGAEVAAKKQETAGKSKAELREERRQRQEQQRAVKSEAQNKAPAVNAPLLKERKDVKDEQTEKKAPPAASKAVSALSKSVASLSINNSEVKTKGDTRADSRSLFPHVPLRSSDLNSLTMNYEFEGIPMHPSIIEVAVKMNKGVIKGSTPRSLALLVALKSMIKQYKTPAGKGIERDLPQKIESSLKFLHVYRPITTGMANAAAYVKRHVTKFALNEEASKNGLDEETCKQWLIKLIDSYIHDELHCALKSITEAASNLICNGDTIMTYGSSLKVKHAIYAASEQKKCFDVIVVDSGPDYTGREMLEFLTQLDIPVTYIYINSISHVMGSVTKVFVGGHSVLANGFVTARMGCSTIALVASSYNVPFIVACETSEFSDAVHTDSFVSNEAGAIEDYFSVTNHKLKDFLINSTEKRKNNLTIFNLLFDLTPPEYVSMVVTEKGILPCSAVSAVIRRNYSKLQ